MAISPNEQAVTGVLSERDVATVLATHDRRGTIAAGVMSNEAVTASPDEDLESLAITMTEHRVRHLPIMDEGRLTGLVSIDTWSGPAWVNSADAPATEGSDAESEDAETERSEAESDPTTEHWPPPNEWLTPTRLWAGGRPGRRRREGRTQPAR